MNSFASPLPGQAVYGSPPPQLEQVPAGALQLSPLHPDSAALEAVADERLESVVVAAPPGAVERRFVLAHALRALKVGGQLTALAPKDKGGARLKSELADFGCEVAERFKARYRICTAERGGQARGIDAAIQAGEPRFVNEIGLWSQPGVFSYDRIDPGSALLLAHMPALQGRGADLGAGLGVLSRAVLTSPAVTSLDLIELDRRALDCARRNVVDERVALHWADVRTATASGLDFVVSNPPFHTEGAESRSLGQDFIRKGAAMLRKGGVLHLVANRHLPYEGVLREAFRRVETRIEGGGYKLIEAHK